MNRRGFFGAIAGLIAAHHTIPAELPVGLISETRTFDRNGVMTWTRDEIVPVQINQQWGQDFMFTEDELVLSIDDFSDRYLEPWAARVCEAELQRIERFLIGVGRMSLSDYMQPGFVFQQTCRYCGDAIRFTRDTVPADFFCSDRCRDQPNSARMKSLRESTAADLQKFLVEHEAVITLQAFNDYTAGAELEVGGVVVANFEGQIPANKL